MSASRRACKLRQGLLPELLLVGAGGHRVQAAKVTPHESLSIEKSAGVTRGVAAALAEHLRQDTNRDRGCPGRRRP